MDLPKLIAGKLLVQANSGGGKSWLIRRLVEQAYGKVQIIILDPEGEFSTLREKFDFVLAGKGGDTPADPKSAALLARRLLELEVPAIVDLYELHPQERKRFVRLFLESMVNAPKELYHDVLVVLDEAHMFAPEKGESEALGSVIDMASRGRKRRYSLVLATQRISKLHKDAAAECNNKLIGRTSLDIDRKRAADELGITSKEEVLALRMLQPGEFFAFGPAISDEVIKVKVGEVQTSTAIGGSSFKVAPPTPKIKAILAKLADLPGEAKKEEDSIAELKAQVISLKNANNTFARDAIKKPEDPKVMEKYADGIIMKRDDQWKKIVLNWMSYSKQLLRNIGKADEILKSFKANMPDVSPDAPAKETKWFLGSEMKRQAVRLPALPQGKMLNPEYSKDSFLITGSNAPLGKGETTVLKAIAQQGEEGITRGHLTTLTGYKRSTRDTYLQRLAAQGYTGNIGGGRITISSTGLDKLGDFDPLPTGQDLREHLLNTLPEGESKILGILFQSHPHVIARETIGEASGYARSSRDTYIQRLSSRELVESSQDGVKAVDKLFE